MDAITSGSGGGLRLPLSRLRARNPAPDLLPKTRLPSASTTLAQLFCPAWIAGPLCIHCANGLVER
jgi:hypothetical protein